MLSNRSAQRSEKEMRCQIDLQTADAMTKRRRIIGPRNKERKTLAWYGHVRYQYIGTTIM